MNNRNTPKLKRYESQKKVTSYLTDDVAELYRVGKDNGWDTPQIVKEAISNALRDREELLKMRAEECG
jgi:uncharacterized protein (UPF0335 family)